MSSGRKTESFFMPGLHTCTSWWPSMSSVTMSTPQEQVQWVLWLAELQSLMAIEHHFRTQYGCQPLTWKSIRFWDNKLRTTGSLLHNLLERHRPLKKMSIALERHFSEVWANQFVLLACSYKLLQQDGAPPHFCHHVTNHLDREMAGRWIGRSEPSAWPPRSPDLTTLDFFL
jgi:hypothetical protein